MSAKEVVRTAELHVYERPLYSVSLQADCISCHKCTALTTNALDLVMNFPPQDYLSLQATERTPVANGLLDFRLVRPFLQYLANLQLDFSQIWAGLLSAVKNVATYEIAGYGRVLQRSKQNARHAIRK